MEQSDTIALASAAQVLAQRAPGPVVVEVESARPLSPAERLWNLAALRKLLLLSLLLALWQVYAVTLDKPLLFPTLDDTLAALWNGILHGELLRRVGHSLRTLVTGYAIGATLAALLAVAAYSTRLGNDLMEILTATFNPLPPIALLPVSLIWFGLGQASIVFVLVHAVLWPMALNAHTGFTGITPTIRMVGRNYGLTGWRFAWRILFPAAFPQLLTGFKIGWAFGWRSLIAAELVYGVSSGSGGIGWFIYENKNQLETASVFAGLLTIILIGLAVENLLFAEIERRTVLRWGMKH
ncbi:ABC transporter permease [Citrifermentans bremense]|uniref:ABC transporter permease n=1 Tax=Citrifermentans bremense TaxID=60035 RepID=UPI0004035B70|nr:ABC transporter permease subunit [Citrifermentans bremense]